MARTFDLAAGSAPDQPARFGPSLPPVVIAASEIRRRFAAKINPA